MQKMFYSSHCFKKHRIFSCFILDIVFFFKNRIVSFFSIVKMATKYAKIDMVGNLDADFQQVSLVQNF